MVVANCSCFNSISSPSMTWYINSQAVQYPRIRVGIKTILYTTTREGGGMDTVLQLNIKLRERHFKVKE